MKTRHWKRSGKIIRHHIINKVNHGPTLPFNLLMFDSERERAWHFIFNNLSFTEVAELLLRTVRLKNRQK